MSIVEKIKLLFKAAKPVGQFVDQIKGARMKYKTIPFWISIVGGLVAIVGSLQGFIPATTGVIVTASLGAAYNILRGLDKTGQVGVKPAIQSTEFWVGIGAILSASIIEVQTAGVNNDVLVAVQTGLGAIMAAAQSLGANQPEKK